MAATTASEEAPGGVLPVLTSVIRRRWTSSVFGIVAEGSVRRRPSDVARALTAVVVVGLAAAGAQAGTSIEKEVLDFLASLPGSLAGLFTFLYGVGVSAVLVITALVARRPRLLLTLLLAGGLGWVVSVGLAHLVDLPGKLVDVGNSDPRPRARLPRRPPVGHGGGDPRRPPVPHPARPSAPRDGVLAQRGERHLPCRGPSDRGSRQGTRPCR